MPTWLHWILTIVLAYPLFTIAGVLVASTSGMACGLIQLFLTGNIGSTTDRFVFSKPRIVHDVIVLVMSVLALLMGVYFFYNEIHIWASISFVVFASLLYQLFPTNFFLRESILLTLWLRFLFIIGIVSSSYFSYIILDLF